MSNRKVRMTGDGGGRRANPKADCSFHINGFQHRHCLQSLRGVKLEIRKIGALITLQSTD